MLTQYASNELHRAALAWFESHGLSVHATHYQFDHSFYAWRHHAEKGSITLWISQIAAEDYPPSTIIAILKDIDPVAHMRGQRQVHVHVTSNDTEFGVHVRDAFSPSAA